MSEPAGYELAVSFLIACCAKATMFLSCGWIFVVALRQRSSAAQRHQVWAAAILCSLALPFLVLLLPAWHFAVFESAAALWSPVRANVAGSRSIAIPSTMVTVSSTSSLLNELAGLALIAWAVGFFFVVLRLLAGLGRLAGVSAKAKPIFRADWMCTVVELSSVYRITRSVRLLQCDSPLAMPLTWGIFRPVVVLPSGATQWSEERRSIVLSHELAHIARHDWLFQIGGELTRAMYWFHPLVWLAAARLRQESERACDDAVLLSGVAPSQYASQLLDLARTLKNSGRAWSTALAIARPSNLERRFAAMLNPSLNRSRLNLKTKLLVSLFALCFLLPLAALRVPAQDLSGKVAGTIHDPSGASVSNATIILTNHTADTIDMTASDRDGQFTFKALPSGEYELKVLKRGFAAYRAPQVTLASGRDFSENITLQVGSISEEVDVVPEGAAKPLPSTGAAGKPPRLRLGGDIEASKLISKVQPVYPEAARSSGVEGKVILHAVIGMDGKPLSLRVMNSRIDPDLARSAVEAVSQWRYTPTLLNGEPIEVDTTITVNYSLAP
jgi:TonB family protein